MWKPKLKNTMPYIIAPKKIEYLGINPTKQVQDLYAEKLQNANDKNQRPK